MSSLSAYGNSTGHEGTHGPPGKALCNCSSRDLFNFGCRCKEKEFHLWYNGVDYVIARDVPEARKLAIDAMGYHESEADGFTGWNIVPSNKEVSIEEDENQVTRLTAKKWVGEIGKPEYLGCTEDG